MTSLKVSGTEYPPSVNVTCSNGPMLVVDSPGSMAGADEMFYWNGGSDREIVHISLSARSGSILSVEVVTVGPDHLHLAPEADVTPRTVSSTLAWPRLEITRWLALTGGRELFDDRHRTIHEPAEIDVVVGRDAVLVKLQAGEPTQLIGKGEVAFLVAADGGLIGMTVAHSNAGTRCALWADRDAAR